MPPTVPFAVGRLRGEPPPGSRQPPGQVAVDDARLYANAIRGFFQNGAEMTAKIHDHAGAERLAGAAAAGPRAVNDAWFSAA